MYCTYVVYVRVCMCIPMYDSPIYDILSYCFPLLGYIFSLKKTNIKPNKYLVTKKIALWCGIPCSFLPLHSQVHWLFNLKMVSFQVQWVEKNKALCINESKEFARVCKVHMPQLVRDYSHTFQLCDSHERANNKHYLPYDRLQIKNSYIITLLSIGTITLQRCHVIK